MAAMRYADDGGDALCRRWRRCVMPTMAVVRPADESERNSDRLAAMTESS